MKNLSGWALFWIGFCAVFMCIIAAFTAMFIVTVLVG